MDKLSRLFPYGFNHPGVAMTQVVYRQTAYEVVVHLPIGVPYPAGPTFNQHNWIAAISGANYTVAHFDQFFRIHEDPQGADRRICLGMRTCLKSNNNRDDDPALLFYTEMGGPSERGPEAGMPGKKIAEDIVDMILRDAVSLHFVRYKSSDFSPRSVIVMGETLLQKGFPQIPFPKLFTIGVNAEIMCKGGLRTASVFFYNSTFYSKDNH